MPGLSLKIEVELWRFLRSCLKTISCGEWCITFKKMLIFRWKSGCKFLSQNIALRDNWEKFITQLNPGPAVTNFLKSILSLKSNFYLKFMLFSLKGLGWGLSWVTWNVDLFSSQLQADGGVGLNNVFTIELLLGFVLRGIFWYPSLGKHCPVWPEARVLLIPPRQRVTRQREPATCDVVCSRGCHEIGKKRKEDI